MLKYKGYTGVVAYDDESDIFHGDVIGIKGAITFKGKSVKEIKTEFKKSIDSYLEICKELGREPAKSFSGKFIVRMKSDLHRKLAIQAEEKGDSLNQLIVKIVENSIT